jgi:uncharacterized cupredoxin-like copper-binding protein
MSLVLLLLAGTVTAGCANNAQPTMMGQGPSSSGMMGQRAGFGGSMMGTIPHGYHMSRLTCAAPTSLPGTRVYVILGDMGMTRMMSGVAPMGSHMMLRAVAAKVPAGKVSFVVGNMGWQTHEMVVMSVAPDQAAGQRVSSADGKVDETGSLGEASASCAAGSGEGIKAGSVGWVTLDLEPGRYELVCNIRNHYANGMHQLFVVS